MFTSLYNSRSKATFKTNRIHYFITISKQQKHEHVTKQDLQGILGLLKLKLPYLKVIHGTYELGSTYHQLHSHLIISNNVPVWFKSHAKFGTFRVFWRQIYNQAELKKYIMKDAINQYAQEQILIINHYRSYQSFKETSPEVSI